MDDVLNMVDKIFDSVKTSETYKEYIKLKEKVNSDEELLGKIENFKKKHFEFQAKKLQQIPVSFEEEAYISRIYHSLILDDDARCFLENEGKIFDLIGEIYNKVGLECRSLIF